METIKFIFSSLFSNQKIIDESKKRPWWVAILLLILSCGLAVVPTIVSQMNVNGSDAISANENYSVDLSLKQLSYQLSTMDGVTAKINSEHEFEMKKDNKDYTEPIKVILSDSSDKQSWTLTMKYVPVKSTDTMYKTSFDDAIKELSLLDPIEKGADSTLPSDQFQSKVHSMLIFTKTDVSLYLYEGNAVVTYTEKDNIKTIVKNVNYKSSAVGDFSKLANEDLKTYYLQEEGMSVNEAYAVALKKWKNLFDKAYEGPRNSLVLRVSLMFSGFNLLLMLIMSLVIFLLSKTKSSIRKYSFLESIKMICFSALCPAILALLISLLIPSLQQMAFVLFAGLRATWLGMKATTPPADNQAIRK